jgi:very-short-patch-repair endonuclease
LERGLGGCNRLKIWYNAELKEKARELRKNATFTERLLWKYLRAGQLNGYRFLRQKPIDEFIVDFYCKRLKLVIEIDGVTHNDKQSYDKRRENRLKELGFIVLRFDGYYILENVTGALNLILKCIGEIEKKHTPNPLSKGESDHSPL